MRVDLVKLAGTNRLDIRNADIAIDARNGLILEASIYLSEKELIKIKDKILLWIKETPKLIKCEKCNSKGYLSTTNVRSILKFCPKCNAVRKHLIT
jgi:Zn finger protein HypA/HybF involved in hydrogenase expression